MAPEDEVLKALEFLEKEVTRERCEPYGDAVLREVARRLADRKQVNKQQQLLSVLAQRERRQWLGLPNETGKSSLAELQEAAKAASQREPTALEKLLGLDQQTPAQSKPPEKRIDRDYGMSR